MEPPTLIAIGTRLPNGAVVIDSYSDIVLCIVPENDRKFVSWMIRRDGDASCGDYYAATTLAEAVAAFAKRTAVLGRKAPA